MNMGSNFKKKLVKGAIICLSTAVGMALSAFIGVREDDALDPDAIEGTWTDVPPEKVGEPTEE